MKGRAGNSASRHLVAGEGQVRSRPDRLELSPTLMRGAAQGPSAEVGFQEPRVLDLALCLSTLQRGWSFNDLVRTYLHDPRFAGAARHFFYIDGQRGREEALKYLRNRWQRAEQYAALHPPLTGPAVSEHWAAVLDAVVTLPLPGKGGPAMAALLWALAHDGLEFARATPRPPLLDLQLRAALSESSLLRARNALVAQGWLKATHATELGRSCEYSVITRRLTLAAVPIEGPSPGEGGTNCILRFVPSHDVWHHAALGLSGWRIGLLLAAMGRRTGTEISAALGMHPRSIRRKLGQLVECGLVAEEDELYAWLDASLDEVAERYGWSGLASARERKAVADSQRGRQWMDQRDAAVTHARRTRELRDQWDAYLEACCQADEDRLLFVVVDASSEAREAWLQGRQAQPGGPAVAVARHVVRGPTRGLRSRRQPSR